MRTKTMQDLYDYKGRFIVMIKKFIQSFFIFFLLGTCIQTEASDRIELEYKFTTNSISEFYMLSHFLDGRTKISLGNKIYSIEKSPNEFFVDYYFDTLDLYLLKRRYSLRMRDRFVHGRPGKRLVQFKMPNPEIDQARFEYKLMVGPESSLKNTNDVVGFLQLPQNRKKQLVQVLSPIVNIASLKQVLELYQIRTRYYFADEHGKPYFTITFDESFARRGMTYKPFYEIEFEINEKQMGQRDKKEGKFLIKQIEKLINEAKSTRIDLYPVTYSKYEQATAQLDIQPTDMSGRSFMSIIVGCIAGLIMAGLAGKFWKRYLTDKKGGLK